MNGSDMNAFNGEENATEVGIGFGSFILRTAARTLLVFLVIFSLAATLIGCLFPKTYMNIYRSLGLYGKASVYASAAAERARSSHADGCDGTCEYSSVLSDGISVSSIAAYADHRSSDRWARLGDLAGDYLAVSCHELRSARIDSTYLREYGVRGLATVSILYGYDDYVWGEYVGSLRVTDFDKATALADKAATAEISADNAEVLNILLEYLVGNSRLTGDDPITPEFGIQCPHFFEAEGYALLTNIYFGYSELAESLSVETLGDAAIKSSLLYRIMKLSEVMDGLEDNYTQNCEENGDGGKLESLLREDKFNAAETERVRALYVGVVSGKGEA